MYCYLYAILSNTKGNRVMNLDTIKQMQKSNKDILIFLKNNNTPIRVESQEFTTIQWDSFSLYLSSNKYKERKIILLVARNEIAGIQFVDPVGSEVPGKRETEKIDP